MVSARNMLLNHVWRRIQKKSGCKLVMSSCSDHVQVASIEENGSGGYYPYRCSKIAANMATKSMSIDLEPQGITSTILHPGYVRTEMTGGQGFLDTKQSITGMIKVLESGVELNGEWYHSDGRHLPW